MKKAHERSHHGHTGTTRHSPRNGFTAYFALSPVTTLFDTVACASYRRLDANDWGVRTTRLHRPQQHSSSSALPASTASRPAFVTIAIRPSVWDETGRISELIWVGRKQKYFCKRGLTRLRKIRSDLPVGQKTGIGPRGTPLACIAVCSQTGTLDLPVWGMIMSLETWLLIAAIILLIAFCGISLFWFFCAGLTDRFADSGTPP